MRDMLPAAFTPWRSQSRLIRWTNWLSLIIVGTSLIGIFGPNVSRLLLAELCLFIPLMLWSTIKMWVDTRRDASRFNRLGQAIEHNDMGYLVGDDLEELHIRHARRILGEKP